VAGLDARPAFPENVPLAYAAPHNIIARAGAGSGNLFPEHPSRAICDPAAATPLWSRKCPLSMMPRHALSRRFMPEANALDPLIERRRRLVSLDAFRGLTVAAMLLVNDPGRWDAIYPPLRHSPWHGWTPTDLIFPFFLFIVGITTQLSLSARRAGGDIGSRLLGQVFRRGAIIFCLGVLLNWFPFYTSGEMPEGDPAWSVRLVDKLLHLRLPGVLQRIAIGYLAGALITLYVPVRAQLTLLAVLLVGYWAALMLIPVPGTGATGLAAIAAPATTLGAAVDRAAFDWGRWGNHLWGETSVWDPEGLLSTLPSLGTVLLGLAAGRWLGQPRELERRIGWLFLAGLAACVLGEAWSPWFPINKNLWSSSYVLLSAGLASVGLSGFMWLIDLRGHAAWARPLLVFGVNPILAYVSAELAATSIYSWITVGHDGQRVAIQQWFEAAVFDSWLPPRAASLGFAILFVLCWYGLLSACHKRGLILKV
jgi:predicted acyltransferase